MAATGVHVRAGVRVTARSYTYVVNEIIRVLLEVIVSAGMDPREFVSSQTTIENGIRTWLTLRELKAVSVEIFDPTSGALAARVEFATGFKEAGDEDYLADIMRVKDLLPFDFERRFPAHHYRIVVATSSGSARVTGWNSTEFLNVDRLTLREIGELPIALAADSLVLTAGRSTPSPSLPGPHVETSDELPTEMEAGPFSSVPGVSQAATARQQAAGTTSLDLEVTIYLSDEAIHEQVQVAVENLLESSGLHIYYRGKPEIGSWYRRMRARTRDALDSQFTREVAMTVAHAAETRVVIAQDAAVTATMMASLGPVITALQPTKDAVIRVGALLIIKIDWVVTVHQLNAAQQMKLDHGSAFAASPHQIINEPNLSHSEPLSPSELGQ